MNSRHFRRRDSIVIRLILAIIGFSSFIAVFTTAVQLFVDYQQSVDLINRELNNVEVVNLAPISKSLWELADETVQLQLDSLVSHSEVDYVAIRVDGKITWRAGQEPDGDVIAVRYPLVHGSGALKRELGNIQIVAGISRIYQQLFEKALVILGTNLLKTLVVAAFMYFLFHIYFTRHLMALGDFARRMSLKGLGNPFRFPGNKGEGERADEFGDIASAMNQMRSNLKESYDELVESEERFRELLESAPDAMVIVNQQGVIILVNKQTETMFEYAREELVGSPVETLISHHLRAGHAKLRTAFIARPQLRSMGQLAELLGVARDGRKFPVEISLSPIQTEKGLIIAAAVRDISEKKQAEEQLRQSQKMEAVGQLTAGVAHDFNNMLAVTLGNAELLEDKLGEDDPQLAAVFRATKRGADLTQRLLAFSRKQVLNPEVVNANNLIEDFTGLLRRTLEEHIDIQTVTAGDLWNCEVDRAQLENALLNLGINARDAMPDGGKLTIETANARLDDDYAAAQADVEPGQYVMLAVSDSGTGMSPAVLAQVFEPFFTTKDVGRGSGLGLSMIYGFVKQSGGHVTIYSEEGEGTTIKLYLPRSTKTEIIERKPVADEVPVARGETVLVVEDDPDLLTLAVALLSSLGYQIIEAATGPAALEQLGSTTGINLLLTDVVLPGGMNGHELAAEVTRRVPGIDVLYMSGYTADAIVHRGQLDAGAVLLRKPFRRADLARAVRKALDGPSS